MTEAEWKQVDKALKSVFSRGAKLRIDGYEVSLCLRQISQFSNAIAVYINGEFRGKWLTNDCEERRRFFCCKKKSAFKDKDAKAFGVRSKKRISELKEKYSYCEYSSHWKNFRKMKKHFIENNLQIELIKIDGYDIKGD